MPWKRPITACSWSAATRIAVLNMQRGPRRRGRQRPPDQERGQVPPRAQVFVAVQKAVREALAAHSPVPSFGTRGAEGWQRARHGRDALRPRTAPARARPPTWRARAPRPDRRPGVRANRPRKPTSSAATPRPRSPGRRSARTDRPRPRMPGDLDLADGDFGTATPVPARPGGPAPAAAAALRRRQPACRRCAWSGQVSNTYIIAEGPDGMFLIDQHAAHERVLYERLDREVRAGGGVPVQPLLQPLTLDLTARQRAEVEPVLPLLRDVGFDVELVRGRANAPADPGRARHVRRPRCRWPACWR